MAVIPSMTGVTHATTTAVLHIPRTAVTMHAPSLETGMRAMAMAWRMVWMIVAVRHFLAFMAMTSTVRKMPVETVMRAIVRFDIAQHLFHSPDDARQISRQSALFLRIQFGEQVRDAFGLLFGDFSARLRQLDVHDAVVGF